MKQLQNTLYILTQGTYLHCDNQSIAVEVGGTIRTRIPAHTLESICCFGNIVVSTPLIGFCGSNGIGLSFVSETGKFLGRVHGPVSGNVLLRKKQFLATEDPLFSVSIIQSILCGKLVNSRNLLLRSAREQKDTEQAQRLLDAAKQLSEFAPMLEKADSPDNLRGLEGAAATVYFRHFDDMLHAKDSTLRFITRSRRPPLNEVNAVLSFLYMLLKNDMQSALESVGLDPACGFLHTLRPGRPSFALDMMEELRAPLCDRMALSLFNRGQLTAADFSNDSGGYTLEDSARKLLINTWQTRKKETIQHAFLNEKISIGLIPYSQALLMARVIRGDLDCYPPFVWR